jgi:hypothetical protein
MLASDTTVQVDAKAALDLTATLTITAGGATTLAVSTSGAPSQTDQGTIALQGDTLVYSAPGGSLEFQVAVAARRMTWLALYTDEFADVDGDGFADETRERLTWLRR